VFSFSPFPLPLGIPLVIETAGFCYNDQKYAEASEHNITELILVVLSLLGKFFF